ncbi:MAG TPA: LytTR family DNA-binding domain-containing protein [Terracidiphilus sp.]|jgi:two-component system LytT family response regulator
MKLRALIADDEPLARERLRFLLSTEGEIEIAGECRNGREVITALKERPCEVLFLDIQMPGGSGFDIIQQVGKARMPVTVFVTAHDHYALQAFDVHALDYLTKPVEPERLKAALDRVKERIASQNALQTQEQLKSMLVALTEAPRASRDYPRHLVVPNGTRDSFVNVDEIEWIEAADYYACLHVGSRTFMLRETIKQLVDTLDPYKFVRVHRSAIVNVAMVREILRGGRSEGWVQLASGHRLKMSKSGWDALLAATHSAS